MNALKSNETAEIDEQHLKTQLQKTLRFIIDLLERYFKNEWLERRHQHIPRIFFQDNNLLHVVTTYMTFLTDEELVFEFSNIAYLIYFISLCVYSKQAMITEHESIPIFEKMFFLMEDAISRKNCMNVLKLSSLATEYWFLIHSRLLPLTHKDINKDPALFQNQIVFLQAMPLCQFLENYFKFDWNMEDIDDLRDFLVNKVCRQLYEYTLRLTYSFRNALVAVGPCTYQDGINAMHYITLSRKHYEPEAAVVVFQILIYALNDIVEVAKINPVQLDLAKNEPNFFFALIHNIKDLIEHFDFKWTHCFESVCVVNVVLDFLLITDWPKQVQLE